MSQPGGPRGDYSQVPVEDAKKMLAQPDEIERVPRAWANIRNTLAGVNATGNTDGNAAGDLRKAVRDVREHWDGPAAEAFEKQANKLVIKMTNLAGSPGTHVTAGAVSGGSSAAHPVAPYPPGRQSQLWPRPGPRRRVGWEPLPL